MSAISPPAGRSASLWKAVVAVRWQCSSRATGARAAVPPRVAEHLYGGGGNSLDSAVEIVMAVKGDRKPPFISLLQAGSVTLRNAYRESLPMAIDQLKVCASREMTLQQLPSAGSPLVWQPLVSPGQPLQITLECAGLANDGHRPDDCRREALHRGVLHDENWNFRNPRRLASGRPEDGKVPPDCHVPDRRAPTVTPTTAAMPGDVPVTRR